MEINVAIECPVCGETLRLLPEHKATDLPGHTLNIAIGETPEGGAEIRAELGCCRLSPLNTKWVRLKWGTG